MARKYQPKVIFMEQVGNLEKFEESSYFSLYDLTEKAVKIYTEDGILQSEVNPESLIDDTVLKELYN